MSTGIALDSSLKRKKRITFLISGPNACNLQAWYFVAVSEEDRLRGLEESCEDTGGWRAAVVGAGPPGGFDTMVFERPFWMIDIPIALSHMSLMAASMGCDVRVHVNGIDEDAINRLVGLPSRLRAVGVLGIK